MENEPTGISAPELFGSDESSTDSEMDPAPLLQAKCLSGSLETMETIQSKHHTNGRLDFDAELSDCQDESTVDRDNEPNDDGRFNAVERVYNELQVIHLKLKVRISIYLIVSREISKITFRFQGQKFCIVQFCNSPVYDKSTKIRMEMGHTP